MMQGSAGQPGNKSIPRATRELLTFPLYPALVSVFDAFVELQEIRHQADYNMGNKWTRLEAEDYVRLARAAFADWARVRTTSNPFS
jgi:hypothetical protein